MPMSDCAGTGLPKLDAATILRAEEPFIMKQSRVSKFSLTLFAVSLTAFCAALGPARTTLAASKADGEQGDQAWAQMIALNQKAIALIRGRKFSAAKDTLLEALVVAKDAKLGNSEMMARTYVHLAAVFVTGEKNRDKGVSQFMLALKIDPNISITPQLETPALKSAYLLARKQMTSSSGSASTSASSPPAGSAEHTPAATAPNQGDAAPSPEDEATTVTKHGRGGHKVAVVVSDPDLPAKVPSPLYCPLPFEIPPGEDLIVRCVTQKQQKKATAVVYYRPEGGKSDDFIAAAMRRNIKGWLQASIPGDAIKGKSLGYYIEARLPGSSEALMLGRSDSPNVFMIKGNADTAATADNENILDTLKAKAAEEEDARRNHRREPGAIWLSLAGGSGIVGFHSKESLDGDSSLHSVAGFTTATPFQLELELGYQWDKNLSLSAMGRYQHAAADSSGYTGKPLLTSAVAAYLRARYAFFTSGAFQTYASAGAGGGNNFLIVIAKQCSDANSCVLTHSDTIHGGPVGILVGAGAVYYLNRTVGIFLDVNEIATAPKFMALTEVNLGLSFAFKFEKTAPAVNEEGLIEKPPENDAPDSPPEEAP
jgi:outer membrane protein W